MPYKTFRQQCQELLEAKRYDELQALLSAEREKIAAEINEVLPYIPPYLPKSLMGFYAKLLSIIWAFGKNRPSFLKEEASLANHNRRLELIVEMEQKLLEVLGQEAKLLTEEARALEKKLAQEAHV